jgi:hypothetical protein
MPGEVLSVNDLAQPLLHHRGIDVVVVDPPLIAGVVRRIDVDALDLSGIERQEGLQGLKVVTVDDQVVVQAHLLGQALALDRDKFVVLNEQMVILDERLAFELDLSQFLLLRRKLQISGR